MNTIVETFPMGESEVLAYEERAWRKYGRNCCLGIKALSNTEVELTYTDASGNVIFTETIKRMRGERPKMDSSEDFYQSSKEDIWE